MKTRILGMGMFLVLGVSTGALASSDRGEGARPDWMAPRMEARELREERVRLAKLKRAEVTDSALIAQLELRIETMERASGEYYVPAVFPPPPAQAVCWNPVCRHWN